MDTNTILQVILIVQLILTVIIVLLFFKQKAIIDKKTYDILDTHVVDDRFINTRFDEINDFLTSIDKRVINIESSMDILKDASIVIHKKGLKGSEKGDKENV